MKNLILTLLFSLPLMAQQHAFVADNGNIVWEKEFPVTNVNVVSLIEAQPSFKVGGFIDNVYTGYTEEIVIGGEGGTALMKNNCKFEFVVFVKDDGYVVKVKNLKFLEKMGPLQMRTVVNSCEKYFMDEKKIRPTPITQGNLDYLDNWLTGVFTGNAIATGESLTSN